MLSSRIGFLLLACARAGSDAVEAFEWLALLSTVFVLRFSVSMSSSTVFMSSSTSLSPGLILWMVGHYLSYRLCHEVPADPA